MFDRKPTTAELEARKAFKPAEPASTEYERAQRVFHDNRERLKAERIAREATTKDARATREST